MKCIVMLYKRPEYRLQAPVPRAQQTLLQTGPDPGQQGFGPELDPGQQGFGPELDPGQQGFSPELDPGQQGFGPELRRAAAGRQFTACETVRPSSAQPKNIPHQERGSKGAATRPRIPPRHLTHSLSEEEQTP
ncbi:hypothetical protein KUCAC02_024021 [Chaenocephalus aceratus]|uniref:Uncharacterized protein n=1 Tax=Chaenocephalus aceratus TaxID=36190 RepID=A0ACB9WIA6_CHAAC|nr:hypothetical protein KUCAC02_024021 [Chaenocephalus aceratus]